MTREAAFSFSAEMVRDVRRSLGISAAQAAAAVGLSDGAAWRRWERLGATGPAAKLLEALQESQAVRRHFGLFFRADSTR